MAGNIVSMRFASSYEYARAQPIANPFNVNSPNCYNARGAGNQVTKEVTLTAAGDPVVTNLFQVTGFVELYRIFGKFIDVTNVADIEEVSLVFDDGGVTVPLTLAAGVVCDGAALNSVLLKVDAATAAIHFMNADQVRVYEVSKQDIQPPASLSADNGADSFIQMLYKSAEPTDLNCQIRWYAEWRTLCGGLGSVVAA